MMSENTRLVSARGCEKDSMVNGWAAAVTRRITATMS